MTTISAPSISSPTRLLMDLPLPPHPTTIVSPTNSPATTIHNVITQLSYENTAVSPRLRHIEKMDEPLEPVPGAKLRLMCSYGGHIIPRPHDRTLCYVGGETRIVVVDRKSSLSDVQSRLSHKLLSGRKFTLKYQLPHEELDNLISITTDEDIENMIEEYDRVFSASPSKPSRIRLFLFLAKPETAASMSALLDNAESWFIDALNGADLLQRGVSDSAAIHNLLEFDVMVKRDPCFDIEAQPDAVGVDQEVHIVVPDSPMVETSSSFDSNISSPSMANISQINVRAEDTITRLQEHSSGSCEQLLQMHVASTAQPPFPPDHSCIAIIPFTVGENSTAVPLDSLGRLISDDEKSDKVISVGLRKPPLPIQPVQRLFTDPYSLPSPNSKNDGAYSLQSPNSVASDGSLTSPGSHSKHQVYLDPPSPAYDESRFFAATNDLKNNIINSSNKMQIQQAHDPVVLPSSQQIAQQQQFVNSTTHYIQHLTPNLMPISSYFPMYAAPKQQHHHQHFPLYLMPVNHSQPSGFSQKSSIADSTYVTSSPSNPVSAAYIELNPSIYSAKTTTTMSTETQADSPKTVHAPTSPYIHVLPNQFQQQYYGVPQGQPPLQSIPSAYTTAEKFIHNYGNEQLKYVEYLPLQYQPMTPATSVSTSQASTQKSADTDTQQMQTSHPHKKKTGWV